MNKLDYEITYIPVKSLSVVWVKSQRPFDPNWAKQIADEFDPDKFEPVIVTKPNGEGIFHIVEGQHRKAGFEQWVNNDGNQQVPCRILDHGDPAMAAEIWLGINKGRKAVRPVTEFLVAVEAKRDVEVSINDIVRRNAFFVSGSARAENSVAAVAALRKVYTLSARVLSATLHACRLLWGSDPHGVSATMICGVGQFVNEFWAHVDQEHLRKAVLAKYKSPHRLLEQAKFAREKTKDPLPQMVSELIRRAYNSNLKLKSKHLVRKEPQ